MSAASGLPGLTSGDDGDLDEAGARRALQEYMAMAQSLQSVQSAQQMALASGLLSAYGSQAVSYLQGVCNFKDYLLIRIMNTDCKAQF